MASDRALVPVKWPCQHLGLAWLYFPGAVPAGPGMVEEVPLPYPHTMTFLCISIVEDRNISNKHLVTGFGTWQPKGPKSSLYSWGN